MGSPRGPNLGPSATGWSNWVGHMAGMLNELTWTYWASISAVRAPNGLFGPNSFRFVAPNLRFGHFLQLGGSKWTEVVLYEQGVTLGRSGHPTCLYSDQNQIRPKMGPQNGRNRGPTALLVPLRLKIEAQYVQVSSHNIPASRMLMDGGHWAGTSIL